MINKNIINHPKYKFESLNILKNLNKIRDSELFIIKDVLQHWKLKDIYNLLDYLTSMTKFKYILITNNGNQFNDNLELNQYIGIGRGLHSKYLPLKKYNIKCLHDYVGGENKHMCLIENKTISSKNEFEPKIITNWNE